MGIRGRHSVSPLGRRIPRHWAIPVALVFSLMAASVAWADQVANSIDNSIEATAETRMIAAGSSTAVGFYIRQSNNTPQGDANGCNATTSNPAYITLNVPAGVSASSPNFSSPNTIRATACGGFGTGANASVFTGTEYSVSFTSNTPGSHSITITSVTGGISGSLWETSGGAFTLIVTDVTPPVITPTVSGTLGNNGWYTSNVSVSWTVTDPESAVTSTSGCDPSSVASDTTGASFTCTATSGGGTASQSVTVKRDTTAPSISGTASPSANGAGWNNTNVSVGFTCSDATSGVASCGPDVTLIGEGAGQSATGTATDQAGNTASTTVENINIDKTAPAVTATAAPAPNGNGWHSADLVVSFTATDGLSGVLSCDPAVGVGSEGTQVVSGSCTDKAGNTAPTSITVNLDETDPSITATRTSPNSYGWNNTDVVVDYSCLDSPSGIDTCGPDETLTTEGAGLTSTGTAVDLAGRTASLTITDINIDTTTPTVACTVPDGSIWYGTNVTVSCTAGDAGAGLENASDSVFTLSTSVTNGSETDSASTGSHTVTDRAGNETTVGPFPFKVDRKAPEFTCDAPDAAWHATNVSFECSATDGGSGLAGSATATLSTAVPASTETDSAYTGTHDFVDAVGNPATAGPLGPNKVDRKAPAITFTRTPANANGWNNGPVTVTFICTDGGSGVASCGPDVTISGESADQSATGDATDQVGNTASATADGIDIDLTKPTATATATPAPNGNGWNNTDVTVTFTGNDGLSGIASCDAPVVLSSEGADQSASGTCTDQAGNVSDPATAADIDIDKTAPMITVTRPNGSYVLNEVVTVDFGCEDTLSGVVSCVGSQANGAPLNTSSVGTKSFGVSAADRAGNTTSQAGSYQVVYATGTCLGAPGRQVLEPVNAGGTSVFKKGSTIPVKFRVCDANGNSIGSPGVVTSFRMIGWWTQTSGLVNEDIISTTPDTAFRWSATDQQWIFNLSTKNLTAGRWYQYSIDLADGTSITFCFGLK